MAGSSGKVQVLFGLFVVSLILYVSIIWTVVSTFLLGEKSEGLPEAQVASLYVMYAFLVLSTLAETVIAGMINNKRYTNRFGMMVVLIFITFLAGKSLFG